MALISALTSMLSEMTWSKQPRRVSLPLRGTTLSRGKHLKRVRRHADLSTRPPRRSTWAWARSTGHLIRRIAYDILMELDARPTPKDKI